MNNPEKLTTLGTQDTGRRQTKQGQSRMNNPEKLTTLGTQDTGRRQTKQGAIKNGQSRETGNIGYTRHRTKTNKTKNTTQKIKKMNNTNPTQNQYLLKEYDT